MTDADMIEAMALAIERFVRASPILRIDLIAPAAFAVVQPELDRLRALSASLAREGEDGELCKRLEIKADMIQLGEKIAYGSDSEIMREACARIRALTAENEALRKGRDEARKHWDDWQRAYDDTHNTLQTIGEEFGTHGGEPRTDAIRRLLTEARTALSAERCAKEDAERKAAELREKVERLKKALEPFAKAASDYERQGEFFSNNVELVLRVSVFAAPEYHNPTAVQVGDLRRARSELEGR